MSGFGVYIHWLQTKYKLNAGAAWAESLVPFRRRIRKNY